MEYQGLSRNGRYLRYNLECALIIFHFFCDYCVFVHYGATQEVTISGSLSSRDDYGGDGGGDAYGGAISHLLSESPESLALPSVRLNP